ncbi:MAG: hypothetical protein RL264_1614 [Bacteroidota bacterium]
MCRLTLCIIWVLFSCNQAKITSKETFQVNTNDSSVEENNTYSKHLKTYYLSNNAPGCVLLVKKNDTVWRGAVGYANIDKERLINPETKFHIGSISKTFTAVLVLQLVDEKKLKLDDKVEIYLPELKGKIKGLENITIRHLLSHTSGLVDPTNESLKYKLSILFTPKKFYKKSTHQLIKEYVFKKKQKIKAGTQFYYSNAGFWLLELLIEKIESKPISEVLENRITVPLKLKNTYFHFRKDPLFSSGYYSGRLMNLKDVTKWDVAEAGAKAPGGIISNVEDLNIFFSNLFKNNLLSAESKKEMKQIQLTDCKSNDCEYGLGLEIWRFDEIIAFGHNGTLLGAEVNVFFFEKENTLIALFKNSGGGSNKSFIKEIVMP